MTARVRVLDVNDNAPMFPDASVVVSFSESAPPTSSRILPLARDVDSPPNGVVDYVITPPSDVFELRAPAADSDGDLKLYVIGSLDREAQDRYQFEVRFSFMAAHIQTSTVGSQTNCCIIRSFF